LTFCLSVPSPSSLQDVRRACGMKRDVRGGLDEETRHLKQ
jgi:hypothetical protein